MKLSRHLKSIFCGLLLGFAYALITNAPNVWLIMGIAFLGVMVPNIDTKFMTKMSDTPRKLVINMFMIPFLITLLIPAKLVTAFFIGYYGHVINDMDKTNNLTFAKNRAITGALWALSVGLIMLLFNLNFYQALGLFN